MAAMNILSIAQAGMTSAVNRFERSAQQTLNSFTPAGSDDDLVQGVVGQIEAKHEFKASVKVAQVADEMMGVLLDMKA
jgi:flagellar hook protein FlgE